eukprot:IDg19499t1
MPYDTIYDFIMAEQNNVVTISEQADRAENFGRETG